MKYLKIIFLVTLVTIIFSGCNNDKLKLENGQMKTTYYTQINMWYQNKTTQTNPSSDGLTHAEGEYAEYTIYSTNYKSGTLLPLNSEVKITYLDRNLIFFEHNNKIYALKRTGHSKHISLEGIFKRTFSKEKVSVEKYDASTQHNILNGEVKQDMSKDAIILSRGYPPEHRTRSLESNTWYYWSTTHNKAEFSFSDNKLISIKE
jgi:hypothetical protein